MSQFSPSGGESIGASVSTSVIRLSIQDGFCLGLTGLISLQSQLRNSQESSLAPQFKSINSTVFSLLYGPSLTSVHDYWKKAIALTTWTLISKVMSLLLNMLSRFVITSLPRSKCLLISRLESPFEGQENKICHCLHFSPNYLTWGNGTGCHNLKSF